MQASWTWGPEGQGAILLVNCDRDTPWLPKEDLSDNKVYSKEGTSGPRARGGGQGGAMQTLVFSPGLGQGGGRSAPQPPGVWGFK